MPEALVAAQKAVESETAPSIELLIQLAICQIESGNLAEADDLLTEIDRKFGSIRLDARVGLRAYFEVARRHYSEALLQTERITNKNTSFYKKTRRDALRGELETSALPDSVRASYEDEASRLDEVLTGIAPENLFPVE